MIFTNLIQESNAYIIIPSRKEVSNKSESRMLRHDHVTCCKTNKKGTSVSLFYFIMILWYTLLNQLLFIKRDFRQRFRYVNLARILFIWVTWTYDINLYLIQIYVYVSVLRSRLRLGIYWTEDRDNKFWTSYMRWGTWKKCLDLCYCSRETRFSAFAAHRYHQHYLQHDRQRHPQL